MKYYGFKSIAKFPRSNLKNLGFANGMAQVIKSLFANNEQGFAFDFNDLSTMYQDAAGTIPVTGAGQPVGRVLDKSGRGNHATQSTSAKRPILQQNTATGAYYLAFDGVDDYLVTASVDFNKATAQTIFAGFTKSSDKVRQVVLNQSNQNIESPSLVLNNVAFRYGDNHLLTKSVNAPANLILSIKINLKSGVNFNVNRVAINSGIVVGGNLNNTAICIGAHSDNTLYFQGNIYSLIGIARLATATEITNTENVIAKNVGVTL